MIEAMRAKNENGTDDAGVAVLLRYAAAMERLRLFRRGIADATRALSEGQAGAADTLHALWAKERQERARVETLRKAVDRTRPAAKAAAEPAVLPFVGRRAA